MVECRDLFPLVKVLQVPAGHAPLLWTALALLDASLRRKATGIPPRPWHRHEQLRIN